MQIHVLYGEAGQTGVIAPHRKVLAHRPQQGSATMERLAKLDAKAFNWEAGHVLNGPPGDRLDRVLQPVEPVQDPERGRKIAETLFLFASKIIEIGLGVHYIKSCVKNL